MCVFLFKVQSVSSLVFVEHSKLLFELNKLITIYTIPRRKQTNQQNKLNRSVIIQKARLLCSNTISLLKWQNWNKYTGAIALRSLGKNKIWHERGRSKKKKQQQQTNNKPYNHTAQHNSQLWDSVDHSVNVNNACIPIWQIASHSTNYFSTSTQTKNRKPNIYCNIHTNERAAIENLMCFALSLKVDLVWNRCSQCSHFSFSFFLFLLLHAYTLSLFLLTTSLFACVCSLSHSHEIDSFGNFTNE